MLFNLEDDSGDQVVGYLVPDGYSAVPCIRVSSGEGTLLTLQANEVRDALVGAGRHETGRCGFRIDNSMVPGLRTIEDLQIHDDETGILIYRRPHPDRVRRRVFRLETHFFPHWRLDDALRSRFQYYLRGAESLGRETVTQLLLLNKVDSSYASGRILYKNYAYYLESGFDVLSIIQDPHEEMAERLLILSRIKQLGAGHLGERDAMLFEAAAGFAETLAFREPKAVVRGLRQMPPEVAASLTDPLVRQLTATRPDEMPGGGALAAALDLLSSFTLVGIRDRPETLFAGLHELFGLQTSALPPMPQFAAVAQLAHILRESHVVDVLLERDLELYYHLNSAIRASSTPPET